MLLLIKKIATLELLRKRRSTIHCPKVLEVVVDIFMHYQKQVVLSLNLQDPDLGFLTGNFNL